jgi:hypothetical protein
MHGGSGLNQPRKSLTEFEVDGKDFGIVPYTYDMSSRFGIFVLTGSRQPNDRIIVGTLELFTSALENIGRIPKVAILDTQSQIRRRELSALHTLLFQKLTELTGIGRERTIAVFELGSYFSRWFRTLD